MRFNREFILINCRRNADWIVWSSFSLRQTVKGNFQTQRTKRELDEVKYLSSIAWNQLLIHPILIPVVLCRCFNVFVYGFLADIMSSQAESPTLNSLALELMRYYVWISFQQSEKCITITQVMNNAAWNKFTVHTQLTTHHSLMSS